MKVYESQNAILHGTQKRLPRDAMPTHAEVKAFSQELSEASGYGVKDEQKESRVVLLSR